MKFLLDFLPLLLFFGTFKYADLHKEWAAAFASTHFSFLVSGGVVGPDEAPVLLATLIVIAATLIQVIALKLMRRKVDLMLWITLGLVVVMGGATVWFHNPTFIKWKPSILYWAMAVALWASQALFKKNLLQSMMGSQLTLPAAVWQRLNLAWVAFFAFMGVLNLYIAYSYSTSTWATFKAFGITGLMLVFAFGQMFFLTPYLQEEADAGTAKPDDKPAA